MCMHKWWFSCIIFQIHRIKLSYPPYMHFFLLGLINIYVMYIFPAMDHQFHTGTTACSIEKCENKRNQNKLRCCWCWCYCNSYTIRIEKLSSSTKPEIVNMRAWSCKEDKSSGLCVVCEQGLDNRMNLAKLWRYLHTKH